MRTTFWIVTAVLLISLAENARAAMFTDFESPTYTAGSSFIGVDGWQAYDTAGLGGYVSTPSAAGMVTDTAGEVLSGAQSGITTPTASPGGIYIGVSRPWGSTASLITAQDTLVSYLMKGAGNFYFSNGLPGGWTPFGIEVSGGVFKQFGATNTSTGVSFNATHTYRIVLAVDFVNKQFTPTIEDLTVPNISVPGTYNMDLSHAAQLTPAYTQANGGLSMFGGETVTWDDFQVYLIPEPASVALLGLGALALVRRKSNPL